jgi:hypothetical protein
MSWLKGFESKGKRKTAQEIHYKKDTDKFNGRLTVITEKSRESLFAGVFLKNLDLFERNDDL